MKSLRQLPPLSPLASFLSDAHTWWRAGRGFGRCVTYQEETQAPGKAGNAVAAREVSLFQIVLKRFLSALKMDVCHIGRRSVETEALLAASLCWCGSSGATFQCFEFPRVQPRTKRRRLFEANVNLLFSGEKKSFTPTFSLTSLGAHAM